MSRRHVAVLMGGWSAEREVSMTSGAAVIRALETSGFRVTAIDVQRDLRGLAAALEPRPDVAFNALHGRGGEDGTVQGVLEFLGLPYTHSGVAASAIAMDKQATKLLLAGYGVPSPRGIMATREQILAGAAMAPPYVIKPVNEGSSVGIRIVREGDNATVEAEGWHYGETVLVEEFIPGAELTVGVMSARGQPVRSLGVTEIRPRTAFFDYTAKYTEGQAEHLLPAPVPDEVYAEAERLAVTAHQALGCSGVSRSDFRWDRSRPGTTGLYFLEINTQPGLTPLSLVPEQAAHAGMPFEELITWMVETASCHA